MTRTRTLVIIGCFMLVLAVLAALELRSGESVLTEGQAVTGALSKASPVEAPPLPSSAPSATPTAPIASGASGTTSDPQPVTQAAAPAVPATGASTSASPEASGAARPLDSDKPQTSSPDLAKTSGNMAAPAQLPSSGTKGTGGTTPATVVQTAPPPAETPSKTEPARVEPKPEPVKTGATKPEQTKPEQAPATPPKTEEPKTAPAEKTSPSRIITTRAPEKLLQGESAIIWTHLELDGKQVIFRFTGASSLEGKGFLLTDPPRYVVDLQGSWGIQLPKVPGNDLVKAIRAGRQEANTRLVFDLARPLANGQVQKVNKETLEVRLR